MPSIPCPVHPDDMSLPRSDIRLLLCGGETVEILRLPIQGRRTLENFLATLEIWKPNIVRAQVEMPFHPIP